VDIWSASTPAGGTGRRPGRCTEPLRPDMTKVPSTYEMEGTSPGPEPAWPVARSSGAADRRRGRTPAQAAGFPAPPASPESPPDGARFQRWKHSYCPA